MSEKDIIDRKELLKLLEGLRGEASLVYREEESNCQCSGDGDDYAKYGARLSRAEGILEAIEEMINEVKHLKEAGKK